MKRYFFNNVIRLVVVFMMALIGVNTSASEYYRVTCRSLNVRQSPSTSSYIMGTLSQGDEVLVEDIAGSWAKVDIDGITGYVSTKYISRTGRVVEQHQETDYKRKDVSHREKYLGYDFSEFPKTDSIGWFFVALVFSVIMVFIFWGAISNGNQEILTSENGFAVTASIFFCTCVFQFIYFITYDGDPTWFCSPDTVGWIWTIINFVIFSVIVGSQLATLWVLVDMFHYHGRREAGTQWGFYGIGASIVGMIICGMFFSDYVEWVMYGLLATQIIQFVIWANATREEECWGNLILTIIFYTVCTACTLVTLIYYMALMVIVLIGLLILMALGHSNEACCGNCRTYRNGYCHYRQEHVSSDGYCSHHEKKR